MSKAFDRLVDIMKKLRGKNGCPWDRKQTFSSIRINLLEETYETIDAINKKDYSKLEEELGDLLLQVVFLSQIAAEKKKFTITDVIKNISDKLVRRHPHVFNKLKVKNTTEVLSNWENIKRTEKTKKEQKFILNDIPKILPALLKAYKTQNKVKRFGFNWGETKDIINRIKKREKDLILALEKNKRKEINNKFGELLFSLITISVLYKINPEESLNKATEKFTKKFNKIEKKIKKHKADTKSFKEVIE